MKIFSRVAFLVAGCGLLVNVARGQTEDECSMSALSEAAQEQLGMYDKNLYLEADCSNGAIPLPVHCNYMGLGQDCRGCFETCDGAMRYNEDFAAEIAEWGLDAIITFCADAEVETYEECS